MIICFPVEKEAKEKAIFWTNLQELHTFVALGKHWVLLGNIRGYLFSKLKYSTLCNNEDLMLKTAQFRINSDAFKLQEQEYKSSSLLSTRTDNLHG